jgi:hypothetical protein
MPAAAPAHASLPAGPVPAAARQVVLALGLGLVLTAAQVGGACVLSGQADFGQAYLSLFEYDSGWYGSIAEHGYRPPDPEAMAQRGAVEPAQEFQANTAFMPGYPFFGRLVAGVTGLPSRISLLVAAQLACWGCWTYLLLLCGRWQLPPRLTALGVLLVILHPGAFFLVAAYAESLFLAGLFGLFYWLDRPGRAAVTLAAAHGFVLGATRLFGPPLALYPLLHAWVRRPAGRLRRWARPLLVSAGVASGGLLFFASCQWHFGRWDLHMETLRRGWGVRPQYLVLLTSRIWHINFPRTADGFLDPDSLGRLLVPLTLLTLTGMIGLEWRLARARRPTGARWRWGLYLCAALMYYVNVSGRACVHMIGMVRYDLCVYALLVLCLVHLLAHVRLPTGERRRWALVLLALWCLAGLVLQAGFLYRFTHGLWVA